MILCIIGLIIILINSAFENAHNMSDWPQQSFNSSFPFYLGKTVIWWGKTTVIMLKGHISLRFCKLQQIHKLRWIGLMPRKLNRDSFFFYLLTAIVVTHAAICSCFLTWSCAFWAGKCRNSRKKKMIHKYSDFVGWHHGACHLYPQSGIWLLPSCMSPHRWAITTVLSVHLYTVTTSRITIWL